MKKIKLTQGKSAWVDDCDYEYLNQWKWCTHKKGKTFYAARNIKRNGKRTIIYMHQVIAKRTGIKGIADHENQDGLDNQRSNLRPVTKKENCENQGISKNNTSGHKGVSWHKQNSKWQASIRHNYKLIHLGYFDKVKDAVKTRKIAEKKYFTHSC